MTNVRADEARSFYEEDEDPGEVFATFDAAEKARTAPTARPNVKMPAAHWADKLRHSIAGILHRTANSIDPPGMRVR